MILRRERGNQIGAAIVSNMIVGDKIGGGEVGSGFSSVIGASGIVVGAGGVLGGVEGSKPNAGFPDRIPDLGGETAPWALPDPTVSRRIGGGDGILLLLCWCRRDFPMAHRLGQRSETERR